MQQHFETDLQIHTPQLAWKVSDATLTSRIQIFLASILKLSDASGLNKQSRISSNCYKFQGTLEEELLQVPQELRGLYESFWTNLPFLN